MIKGGERRLFGDKEAETMVEAMVEAEAMVVETGSGMYGL